MEDMYTILKKLCAARGITLTDMCRESGVPRSSVGNLATGSTQQLSAKNVQKLANYFNISTDYLLGKTDQKEKAPILNKKDERDISKKLAETIAQLEQQQDGLMFDGEPLDDETRQLLEASLRSTYEMSKRIAKEKYTPKKYRKP